MAEALDEALAVRAAESLAGLIADELGYGEVGSSDD
jgi:hypothetical protein